jgi:hypothetical protein
MIMLKTREQKGTEGETVDDYFDGSMMLMME